jgi:PKD repeat protein
MINNAINSGSFILQHRDHGMETGWGEPSYTNGHINNLTNTDLTFIMSINCLTGKYNWGGECFTEKFHRHTKLGNNAGALGLIAASETSYSFVNDCYVWGVYDNWWPEFMPTYGSTPLPRGTLPSFGNAAGKYFLQQSSWPYNTSNKPVTYALFHHHGESFSVIYSEVPQNLTVSHEPEINMTATSFTITATEGSTVALTLGNTIVGCQTAGTTPLTFTLPAGLVLGQNFVVTATKQNFRRYKALVPIISDVLTAQFTASATQGCETLAVDFTDVSAGTPTSWEWTFEGATPSSSTVQNPTGIVFAADASYTVSLKVGDGTDFHTTTMTNYITVNNYPSAPISSDTSSCIGQAVPDLEAAGENIKWYTDANLTAMVSTGNVYTTGLTAAGSYTYYVTQSSGICQSEPTEIVLTISNIPMVSVSAFNPVCANTEAFEPTNATPAGGTWDGTGVSNNLFDPAVAGVGTHDLTYTFTNAYGCSNTASASILINDLPVVALASFGEICENGTPVALGGGTPEGGIFSGPGVDAGTFNPEMAGAGEIPVSYTVTDLTTTCTNTATSNYMVNPVPVVAFGTDTTVCHNLTILLDATFANSTYLWSTGSSDATLIVDTTGVGLSGSKTISVDVTTSKACTKNSSIVVNFTDCTGIGELNQVIGMNVYPNPNNGQFTLELNAAVDMKVNLRLINVFGANLWNAQKIDVNGNFTTRLNFNALSDGIYFLILESNGANLTRKLIIKK